MSVVVVADEPAPAEEVAQRVATQIWRERDGFVYQSEPLRDSLERALRISGQPSGVQPRMTAGSDAGRDSGRATRVDRRHRTAPTICSRSFD